MAVIDYQKLEFEYRTRPAIADEHHAVVVVGAGPVGLSMALDLAQRGQKVVVLDDDYRLSTGSRAICFAKRTLDIWDRLGVGSRMVDTGVSWNVGRVFFRNEEVWRFDLLPESGHRRPAFINLQQYYCEGFLHEAATTHPNIELRWKNKVVAVDAAADPVSLTVDTPDGSYALTADWLVACDGSRSPVRKMIGQESHGRIFRDRFLIADVRMTADFPVERWFWFDPPFHPNQSVLLHSQPDNVWRIDFQLGWDADPVAEVKPENVIPRIQALLGKDVPFELEWVSIYTFACERMDRFKHGRVVFAGDSAHRVSPFGARGANSGVQDADNLAWKLDLVLRGLAPASLIDSYAQERERAADENILNSSRSTDFITPKSDISRLFRNTVLKLAKQHDFARKLVNSGRLSLPTCYSDSALNTPDIDDFTHGPALGACCPDAPVRIDGQPAWWLGALAGNFTLAVFCPDTGLGPAEVQALESLCDATEDGPSFAYPGLSPGSGPSRRLPLDVIRVHAGSVPAEPAASGAGRYVIDCESLLASRYDATPGTCYLIRPDQHVAARWRHIDADAIRAALKRAIGAR